MPEQVLSIFKRYACGLWVSNSQLSSHRQVDKSTAMRFPAVTFQIGLSDLRFTADLCRRIAFERSVKAVVVVINLESIKLSLQIDCVPEQRLVKKLSTNGPDQAFDEWV